MIGQEKKNVLAEKQLNNSRSKLYVVFLTCFAAIGGLLFGYDTGIVSGSMLLIRDVYTLSTIWQELIVSATIGAAAVFSLIAGILSDRFGRKTVIMLASFVFTVGAGVMAAATGKEMLLAGRIIVGLGIGFASMCVPVYIAEVAPSNIRGILVTINQLFITIGILVSSIIAGAFSSDTENGWRYMLGISGVPSIIQFLGFIFLPESPRYLVAKDQEDKARNVLCKIRGTQKVEFELNDIKESVQKNRQHSDRSNFSIFITMLRKQPVRSALTVGCLLSLFAQLSGINTVIYYSASILRMAGFSSEVAIWLVCIPNGVNFLSTFIGICLVERVGRRILTLCSFIGVIISLLVLAAGFQLSAIHSPPINVTEGNIDQCGNITTCQSCISEKSCGFCYVDGEERSSGSCLPVWEEHPERYAYSESFNGTFRCNETNYNTDSSERMYVWADSFCPSDYTWMVVLGLAMFVMAFAPGIGPNGWTIISEIYPLWARGTGMSLSTAINWTANLAVSLTFLTLTENITTYGKFYLFAGLSTVGFITMLLLLPETKNKSLEEVEELFVSTKYRRKNLSKQPVYGTENNAYTGDVIQNTKI